MNVTIVKIGKVRTNPNNPRVIKDKKFEKLVKSIKEFPDMLRIRPIVVDSDYVVLGGNMRLKACKEAEMKEIPIIVADELTEEQKKEFVIKDNASFGEWDWDNLANEWEAELLDEWGLDVPFLNTEEEAQQKGTDVSDYNFETFDERGVINIRIILPDEQAKHFIETIDNLKGDLTLSEFIYAHFCNWKSKSLRRYTSSCTEVEAEFKDVATGRNVHRLERKAVIVLHQRFPLAGDKRPCKGLFDHKTVEVNKDNGSQNPKHSFWIYAPKRATSKLLQPNH